MNEMVDGDAQVSADGMEDLVGRVAALAECRDRILAQIRRRIVGQDQVIDLL